jgi:hypothetical protein
LASAMARGWRYNFRGSITGGGVVDVETDVALHPRAEIREHHAAASAHKSEMLEVLRLNQAEIRGLWFIFECCELIFRRDLKG